MTTDRLPPPRPAPDPLDDDCAVLLGEPFASAWRAEPASPALRERLLARIGRSARTSQAFVTVRGRDAQAQRLASGVSARTLYRSTGESLRAGEPWRVRLVELAPGAAWQPDLRPGAATEWLVITGSLRVGELDMDVRDFHRRPGGPATPAVHSACGARFYLRETPPRATADDRASTVRDAEAPWQDFAPAIKRRVLWHADGESALLYHALPGAQVPRHGHGHDEECLMLDGEVFLDDVLLRQGDWQLAPAGTEHGGVATDTGGLLFAHGDLDLDIRPA